MDIVTEWLSCPHCGERIEIVLDLSVAQQQYVEDCCVCCRPISIRYRTDGEVVETLEASAEDS